MLLAETDDLSITARTLEYWRHEGLLPKAERTGQVGKHPEWTYPAGVVDQLAELLRLRHRTRRPDVLRVALWFRGYPIDVSRVRASIVAVLSRMQALMIKEIEKRRDPSLPSEESAWAAIEQVGQLVARKRGKHAPPRFGRQTREDRERATTVLIGLALGYEDAVGRVSDDAGRIERMIGVDQARRARAGLGPWLSGPPSEGFEAFSAIGSLPSLIQTVETATDDELISSGALGRTMLDGITAFSRMADAFALAENAVGLGVWEAVSADPAAAVWVTAVVVAVQRADGYNTNLNDVVLALRREMAPLEQHARRLAELPAEELARELPNLEGLPFLERVRLERLIAVYRDAEPQ